MRPLDSARLLALAAALAAAVAIADTPRAAREAHASHPMPMTDEAMARWVADWFASHPRVGTHTAAGAPAATFIVTNFRFDADGSALTQVDTVHIIVGDAVLWQWEAGFHTVTSGTPDDPEPGLLFDQPSDAQNQQFTFVFDQPPGWYPFHCRPHAFADMVGVVHVASKLGVDGADASIGFVRDPAPNPTAAGASMSFALAAPGRARIEVFDVRGRRVAVALDRLLPAGTHAAAWDGRDARGRAAAAGVYVVRLTLPGRLESRRLVVTR